MKYAEKVYRGSTIVFASTLIGGAIGYFLRIVLARYLSIADYGLFYSILTFFGTFAIFVELGLGQTMVKFISAYRSTDREKIKPTIGTVLAIQMATSLAITIPIIIFSDVIAIVYFKTMLASLPLKILAITSIVGRFMGTFQVAMQGLERIKVYSIVEPIRITCSLIIFVMLMSLGVIGAAYSYFVATLITAIALLWFLYTDPLISGNNIMNKEATKKLLTFSIPVFIAGLAGIIISYTDVILITIFRGVSDVGLYQVALPTSQLLWIAVTSLIVVLFPVISEMWAKKKTDAIGSGICLVSKFSFIVVSFFAILMVAFSEEIIRLLFGQSYSAASFSLQILAINSVFYTLFTIFSISLVSVNKPFLNTKIIIFISLVNFGLNIIFIPIYGIAAAAASISISYFIGAICAYHFLGKIVPLSLDFPSLGKSLIGGLISMAIVIAIKSAMHSYLWLEIVISLIVSFLFYFVFILKTRCLTKEDITFLGNLKVPIPRAILSLMKKIAR